MAVKKSKNKKMLQTSVSLARVQWAWLNARSQKMSKEMGHQVSVSFVLRQLILDAMVEK